MNSTSLADRLRDQAVALRRAGKSRREIKEILGIGSNATLNAVLAGEPPPAWTRRPRAKDDMRAKARTMREQGHDYEEIAAALGVSKSSVSLWVRDMPRPERLSYEECRKRSAEGARRYWEAERPAREARREAVRAAAAAEIGALTPRELVIAGAIAYWCEGAKSKPYERRELIQFINSDPGVIRLFLAFLKITGVDGGQIRYRLHIHESADIAEAERFWLDVTSADSTRFLKPTIKRHNPRTARRNVGKDYHGCLCVSVHQSVDVFRRIEGWARAVMTSAAETNPGNAELSPQTREIASLTGIVGESPEGSPQDAGDSPA